MVLSFWKAGLWREKTNLHLCRRARSDPGFYARITRDLAVSTHALCCRKSRGGRAAMLCCSSTRPNPGRQMVQVEQPKMQSRTTPEKAKRLRLLASDVPWFKIAACFWAKPVAANRGPFLIHNNPLRLQKFRTTSTFSRPPSGTQIRRVETPKRFQKCYRWAQ